MNHYSMLACKSKLIPPTITLSNYSDGSSVDSDRVFLSESFSFSIPNLFRLLTILSKPKNKYNFTYAGKEDGLHKFAVEHNNDYSPMTQFRISDTDIVFHVKRIAAGTIHAVLCTEDKEIPQSGSIEMMTLPIRNLLMSDGAIVFDAFGLFFKITSAGKFHAYTSRQQRELGLSSVVSTAYTNSDVHSGNQYCILFGENDFVISSDNYNNYIRNFVYIRREQERVIVMTQTNCGIWRNGVMTLYDFGNREMIANLNNLATQAELTQFVRIPVMLNGSDVQMIECSIVWSFQKIANSDGNAYRMSADGNIVIAPLSDNPIIRPCISFMVGENR